VAQVVDGQQQLAEAAEAAGRDPASIRVRVLGAQHQWRKRQHLDAFAAVGVEEMILWLNGRTTDDIRRELDALAAELLSG